MAKGPFANFLTKLSYVQQLFKEKDIQPIRTALVTSRNAPAHERAVKTLRNWGVSINEAFFLGGVSKTEILAAFGAHIFFDDQDIHTERLQRLFRQLLYLIVMEIIQKNKQLYIILKMMGENDADIYICFKRKI